MQPRLITRWQECHISARSGARVSAPSQDASPEAAEGTFASPEQRAFFGLCCSYKDIFFPLSPYPTR